MCLSSYPLITDLSPYTSSHPHLTPHHTHTLHLITPTPYTSSHPHLTPHHTHTLHFIPPTPCTSSHPHLAPPPCTSSPTPYTSSHPHLAPHYTLHLITPCTSSHPHQAPHHISMYRQRCPYVAGHSPLSSRYGTQLGRRGSGPSLRATTAVPMV